MYTEYELIVSTYNIPVLIRKQIHTKHYIAQQKNCFKYVGTSSYSHNAHFSNPYSTLCV